MTGVHHVDLVVSSLETSYAFYRELLEPLGWRPSGTIVGERGEEVRYLSSSAGGELGLRERQSEAVRLDRYAVGIHHICFSASHRRVVDERARWLRDNGHEIESGPEEYGYTPGYYAVFFYDPDGIKLEIVHAPGE